MSVFTLLKQDHRKVAELLEEGENTTDRALKTREQLFAKIKKELKIHTKMEEQTLYPVLKNYKEVKDLILEAYEEHHVVDLLLAEIEDTAPDEETWKAKLTVLKENVKHHVKEEEQELFPQIEKLLSADELKKIEQEMLNFKEQNA